MRTTLAAAVLLILTSTAIAGSKPSSSQAKKAAKAWLKALKGSDEPDLKALATSTAVPFVSGADSDGEVRCAVATTSTADKLGDVYDCIGGTLDEDIKKAKLGTYHKNDLGTQYADHVKGVASIKDAAFVFGYTECAGSQTFVVLAVVKDGKDAKVAGVFVVGETCGE
ncbi:MAG TPA: hypothetical protein VL463_05355 [Kofleriaceae bacterium]|nr:hypothetical protein [Kofleriaceae bacterium]